jgi:tripartite-type tricarboxylate transporter receptor subunit TctC
MKFIAPALLTAALPFFASFIALPTHAAATDPAAAFPARPLRIIVGFPAGSGTDILARYVGGKLSERLDQPVVVDNRPGANGIIASELLTKSAPDGHTMQFMSTSHTMNAAVHKLPFDAVQSFTPIALLAEGALALVTHPSFPARSVQALIELARKKPNGVSYAVSGTGGINHFAGGLFSRMAGIQLLDVPYRGGPQALTDVIAGEVNLMFGTVAITHRQVKAGKLTALGVSTPKRAPLLPDVPSISEAGVPGYAVSTWWGVIAPAGVPAAIVQKLNREIGTVVTSPESKQRLENNGAQAAALSSMGFGQLLATEVDKWRRVARESNIKAD